MNTNLPDVLVVSGHINRATYQSMKKYLLPPVFKVMIFCLIVGYDAFLLYQVIANHAWLYLAVLVIYTAMMIFLYFRSQNGVVKRIISQRKELRDGDGFEISLTLRPQGIRMFNNTTGRELNLRWQDFISICTTERCITLYVKKNKYLMIPRENMDEAKEQMVMEIIRSHCPKLRKRW